MLRLGNALASGCVSRLIAEAKDLSRASIELAEGIDHATSGERLGRVMREMMSADMAPYHALRQAVEARLDELGGVGKEAGLFMLAADMATTAEMAPRLDGADRRALRRLWDDLRAS
jgi:hypothetical protein